MKKYLALLLAAIMALSLAACASTAKTEDAASTSGKLTMATEATFPPYEYYDGDAIVGIDVEVAQAIADKLGMELEVTDIAFDSIIPGVQTGKFDVGMSGIPVTEKRQKNADFTEPYFLAAQSIVVLSDSDITCKADLEGKTVSVQTGTTAESCCTENGYTVMAYQANNDACTALTSGKVDAWVVDNEVAVALSAEQNGATKVLDEAMTTEPYAFAFAKGSDSLVEAFNKELNAMIEDGTVQGIFDSYGVPYVSPKQ